MPVYLWRNTRVAVEKHEGGDLACEVPSASEVLALVSDKRVDLLKETCEVSPCVRSETI
jgi:hypothetical protein